MEKLIINYLNKKYSFYTGKFIGKNNNQVIDGFKIIDYLTDIFSIKEETSTIIFNNWALFNGVTIKDYRDAWGYKRAFQWSSEGTQDFSVFHNIDAEAELTALLSEAFAAEIDREIIKQIWEIQ